MFKTITSEQLDLFFEQHCHNFHGYDGRVIKNAITREFLIPMTANTAVYTHNILHDYMSLSLVPDTFLEQMVEYHCKIKHLGYDMKDNISNKNETLKAIFT